MTQFDDKSPFINRNVKTVKWQHKQRHQKIDYTAIADRLWTVSWSNYSHPAGMVKPFYGRPTFPLAATAMQSKEHTFKNV